MTDDLRTRIAAVLAEAQETHNGISDLDLADAVIAELGLRQEYGVREYVTGVGIPAEKAEMERMSFSEDRLHRYVTEWELTDD